jgi:hypothetical protein
MYKARLFGIMALALTGLLASACGDDDPDDLEDVVDERIDELDLDDDFVVTRDEWNNAFVVWDEDGNQQMVVGEFRFNGNGFETADVNNDGFVTDDEWEDLLDAWDIDGDDVLEEFEFEPYL